MRSKILIRVGSVIFNLYRKLFSRRRFYRFNLTLFHLGLRGMGVLNHENDTISGERHFIHKILPGLLRRERPVFFDIGAHKGAYTALLSDRFPDALIHAFEPHPLSYDILKGKFSGGRVSAHAIALGETCGKRLLYDRADQAASSHASFYGAVISRLHGQNVSAFEVAVETLDHFAEKEGIKRIDFVKIDTEGNELSVLRGASKLLERGDIGCVQFEFNEMNVVSRVFFRDIKEILRGYELFRLLPKDLLPLGEHPLTTELFAYQNIIAIPRNPGKG